MSGSGEQSEAAKLSQRFTTQHPAAGIERQTMLAPTDAGIAAGSSVSQQRGAARGQRSQTAVSPTGGLSTSATPPSQSQAQHQPQGYQQLGYPWYQQRAGHFPQGQVSTGQMAPYGWLPYNVGYQVFGDQMHQPGFYQEGQPHHNQLSPYQLAFLGQPDMPNYAAGGRFEQLTGERGSHTRLPGTGGGRHGFMQHQPFFPHVMEFPTGRGRPPRNSKPAEDISDSFNFDMTEARERPETARRTLMLRNIPNKYTIHMLLDMLDKCHKRGPNELVYDFCYLPIDFKNRCNLGYAFVNFVDAAATAECFTAFNAKRWNDFNSKKVCEVKYARVQGKDALIEHFRNSKFPSNDVDCLPLLFEKVTQGSGEQVVRSVPLHSKQST